MSRSDAISALARAAADSDTAIVEGQFDAAKGEQAVEPALSTLAEKTHWQTRMSAPRRAAWIGFASGSTCRGSRLWMSASWHAAACCGGQ